MVFAYALLVCFLSLHIYLKQRLKPSFEVVTGAKVGQFAKSFEVASLNNEKIQLASTAKAHKLTILNFWESWCGPCKIELSSLEKLYSANKNNGLAMIGIYHDSNDDSVSSIVREDSLTFPIIHDRDGRISQSYGVEAVPTIVVIDSNLKVVREHQGLDMGLEAFISRKL